MGQRSKIRAAEPSDKTPRKVRASNGKFMPLPKETREELEYLDMMFNARIEDPKS